MIAFFFFFFTELFEEHSEEYYSQVFAERLKAVRQAKGKTQKDLAEALGITTASMCNYEKGILPSLANTLKLADKLSVSLDYLFARGNETAPPDPPKLGSIARSIIAPDNTKLSAFLSEYYEYRRALEANPNPAMQKMFDSWLEGQLKELDQIPLE